MQTNSFSGVQVLCLQSLVSMLTLFYQKTSHHLLFTDKVHNHLLFDVNDIITDTFGENARLTLLTGAILGTKHSRRYLST